jgi:hypothetical protein
LARASQEQIPSLYRRNKKREKDNKADGFSIIPEI